MGYTYLVLADTPAETAILKLYNAQDPSEFCLSTPFTISQVPVYTLTSLRRRNRECLQPSDH
ncbi:MAG: hypothetical protein IPH20_01550 [Bacteroidales bacterium]|nr:hypothetical protein [Bacteroidales bacterium]